MGHPRAPRRTCTWLTRRYAPAATGLAHAFGGGDDTASVIHAPYSVASCMAARRTCTKLSNLAHVLRKEPSVSVSAITCSGRRAASIRTNGSATAWEDAVCVATHLVSVDDAHAHVQLDLALRLRRLVERLRHRVVRRTFLRHQLRAEAATGGCRQL